ncbi:Suppressor of lurcher protein 1 [Nymphon striatum]|nr:Suppressor of lurcher protein 1 [Nymphon striatum]
MEVFERLSSTDSHRVDSIGRISGIIVLIISGLMLLVAGINEAGGPVSLTEYNVSLLNCVTLVGLKLKPIMPTTISGSCQCIIYDKTNGKKYGVFTSPDHPVAYETEIKCLLYTFTADPDEIVKVSFDEFDIQRAKPECIFGDYVKLFLHLDQPMVNEYSPWNRVLCGKIQDIDQIYYSAKNSLIFEFHSDWRNGNNTGFRGTYRFIKKKQYITDGEKVPDTKCDYQFSSSWTNSSRGRFFSPLYPSLFKRGSKCSYRFVGYIHERVRVIFEKVSFEKSDSR